MRSFLLWRILPLQITTHTYKRNTIKGGVIMNANIERFLEKCKNDYHDMLKEFGNDFNEEKYNLILKIREVKPISNEEWDLIQVKYRADLEMARVLITTPFVYSHMKMQVVQDFLDGILKADLYSLKNNFVEDILMHYKSISEVQLEELFYKEHARVTNSIKEYGFDNGIPEKIAKQILHTELSVLDGKLHKPVHFHPQYEMFSQINSESLLKFVLDNMPKNAEYSEQVATALINSPYISDEKKNEIFALYGCDCNELKLPTPEMLDAIYLSAVETALPEDKNAIKKDRTAFINMNRAGVFIDNMIDNGVLPEALQYDLVNRLVEDEKKYGERKMNDTIGLLIEKSKSPKVLHLIYKSAVHVNDRHNACMSSYASIDDKKEESDTHCKKIMASLQRGKDPSEKWFEAVSNMMMQTEVSQENYEDMLKTKNRIVIEGMISSMYTPKSIFKRAQKIANKQAFDRTYGWRTLQVKAVAKEVLEEKGLLTEEYYRAFGATISSLISQFDKGSFMRNITIASDFYRRHPDISEKLIEMCLEVANRLNYTKGAKEDCLEEMEKYLSAKARDLVMRDWSVEPPENMTPMQVKRAKNNLTGDFADLLKNDVGTAYTNLSKIADRYTALDDQEIKFEERKKEFLEKHPEYLR